MNNKLGYIYCLSNPSFDKDVYKIGFTQNEPHVRKSQLYTTELPTPFKLEFAKKVLDYKTKEKQIHKVLSKYRININREFFKLPLSDIKNIFDLIDGELYIDTIIIDKKKNHNNLIEEVITEQDKNVKENANLKYTLNYLINYFEIEDELHNNCTTNIVQFGTENLNTILSQSEILQILNKGVGSLEESIKLIHFNDMRPEFKNIYITNLKDQYAYIYNGFKFIAIQKSYMLKKLFLNHLDNIHYCLNKYKDQLDELTVEVLNKFIESVNKEDDKVMYNRYLKGYSTYKKYDKTQVAFLRTHNMLHIKLMIYNMSK